MTFRAAVFLLTKKDGLLLDYDVKLKVFQFFFFWSSWYVSLFGYNHITSHSFSWIPTCSSDWHPLITTHKKPQGMQAKLHAQLHMCMWIWAYTSLCPYTRELVYVIHNTIIFMYNGVWGWVRWGDVLYTRAHRTRVLWCSVILALKRMSGTVSQSRCPSLCTSVFQGKVAQWELYHVEGIWKILHKTTVNRGISYETYVRGKACQDGKHWLAICT